MSETADCGTDIAAYVLSALDAHEVDAFERHLDSCSICQTEVESLRLTVSVLPMSAPQFPVPRDLHRRVMRSVRAEARPELQTAAARPASDRSHIFDLGRGSVPRYAPGAGFRPGLVYGVMALVLVLVVVAVGVTAAGSSSRHGGPEVVSASTGSAKAIVTDDHAELIVQKLPRLSSGQTYEVWTKRGSGSPQPTRILFNTATNGEGDVTLNGSTTSYDELLVTREPAGGRARPTNPPVVVVRGV